jgi:type III pantothenate kinase
MHLVFDEGNTDTVIGLFHPESLEPSSQHRFPTARRESSDPIDLVIRGFLRNIGHSAGAVSRAVVGSVAADRAERLREALGTLGDPTVVMLEGWEGLPIRPDPTDPAQGVGADRIANALAAARLYRCDTIIVDLGTATTFDCVGADGTFFGGVIAPGLPAGSAWLESRTPRLPPVTFGPPDRVIGRRTVDCIRSGLFYSVIDAVDGIVERIRSEWARPNTLVVGTGGHAGVLAAHSRHIDRVNPDLTLVGLKIAGDHLAGDYLSGGETVD